MALFPKIQSPCPLKARAAQILNNEYCGACRRTVHDLSAWSDAERAAFVKACGGDVCVSYRLPASAAAALAAVAAAATPLPVAAQSTPAPTAAARPATTLPDTEVEYLVMGGITDPDAVEYVEAEPEPAPPELPVVYDDDASSPPDRTGG